MSQRCFRVLAVLGVTAGSFGVGVSIARGDLIIDVGRGPVVVHVPPSYDPGTPAPLVMLLHGYGASGALQEAYMRFTPLADAFGFLYVFPNGTIDCAGNRFWNATDACCNFCDSSIDDSGYLSALIDAIKIEANIDERRVCVIGHSNGGFMAYRMACDHADTIAAIVSLAGATFLDAADCTPSEPVHTLQIHGTADGTILYNGGCIFTCYPGAVATTEQWAAYDGCAIAGDTSPPPLDLDGGLPGDETVVTRYAADCDAGGSAELWTIVGGAHVPALSDDFSPLVIEFLLAHPKPARLPGDVEGDGDVDLADFGVYARCMGGPDTVTPPAGCDAVDFASADLDGDADVDLDDFAVLSLGFTG
ncbi:MAG: alpha/beta hydrolase family esterase [Phycisphaerae bacterium]